jgi:hypothetical protein
MLWRILTIVHNHYPIAREASQIRNRHNYARWPSTKKRIFAALGWVGLQSKGGKIFRHEHPIDVEGRPADFKMG